ncbi:MAG: hypothetical protein Q7T81_05325 [Pseudolabrys sp.]|nr:hypothetical protein [Pseudolabrys sp.]
MSSPFQHHTEDMMRTQIDDDMIAKDGEVVRVAMHFMTDAQRAIAANAAPVFDMAGHRPGPLPQTDEQREQRGALYDKADAAISARWKNASAIVIAADGKPPQRTAATTDAAYGSYDKRMSERWRAA